jgi:complement component 1 Q subcomponent-binding protein, mitochondrial
LSLRRTFTDLPRIKVEFSISDMHEYEEDEEMDDYPEDPALHDEEFEKPIRAPSQTRGETSKAEAQGIDPAESETEGGDGASTGLSYPLNLLITITKPGNQALVVRATIRDGVITTDQINYVPKANLAAPKTMDETTESGSLYSGPPFENLDTDLQVMFETYLEERGINAELANTLPQFVEWKEQREYVDWLQSEASPTPASPSCIADLLFSDMKKFIDT